MTILNQQFQYDSTHHPSDEQLIKYFDGKLPEAGNENLQAHLADCDNCLEVFKDVRDFFETHREDDEVVAEGRFSAWTAFWKKIREEENENIHHAVFVPRSRINTSTAVAIAALLLVVLALGIWVIRQRRQEQTLAEQLERARQQNAELQVNQENLMTRTKELEQQILQLQERARVDDSGKPQSAGSRKPELNPPIYDLYARDFTQRSGSQSEVNQIKVPASANSIILILNGEGLASSPNYGVEIVNDVGKLIWRARGLRKGQLGNLTLTIDRSFLGAGTYRLKLYGQEGWSSKALAEYVMRIE
jgi:hypothetical protein